MELGVISLSDLQVDPATGRPVAAVDRLDDTLGHAGLADRLSLDVFALGEHHRPQFAVDRTAFRAGPRRGGALMIGTSDQLIEKILDARAVLGITRLFGQVDWCGIPRARVEDSHGLRTRSLLPSGKL